ncbi:MAG: hypothetical protein ACOCZ7_01180 [Armatimonadota bacterium]
MPDDDVARLQRLLAWREAEEERARRAEASALRTVEIAQEALTALNAQLQACRDCALGGADLIDAHMCAARLTARVVEQERALKYARDRLRECREELVETGRRRIAVERMAASRVGRLRNREAGEAQSDLDEGGRLRLVLEGDRVC